jgi:3-oxoacyl-[acyl-carrier protein] reductase
MRQPRDFFWMSPTYVSALEISSIIRTPNRRYLTTYRRAQPCSPPKKGDNDAKGRLGITVNAIAPGFIETELTQGLSEDQREKIAGRSALRGLAGVDDVARMVEYLLGDGGRTVTGTVFTIDAGNTA